jgi:hypothetical protein
VSAYKLISNNEKIIYNNNNHHHHHPTDHRYGYLMGFGDWGYT